MMMTFKSPVLIMWIVSLLSGCSSMDAAKTETGQYKIYSVNIYQNTPAWELAQAVRNQDTKKIAEIAKSNPKLLEYHDPIYSQTLLIWAVGTERYDAAEALLKAGANPNATALKRWGETALHVAANFSYVDSQAKSDPKYVKLLLKYGANPNIGLDGSAETGVTTEIGRTPLMNSIGCGIEKTKALVEGGADINARTQTGWTAAIGALMWGGGGTMDTEVEYAHYLIVEKHADITKPWLPKPDGLGGLTRIEPVTLLRDWTRELDSEAYRKKMDVVKEFARQGVDYWKTEIPKSVVERAKKCILIPGRNISRSIDGASLLLF